MGLTLATSYSPQVYPMRGIFQKPLAARLTRSRYAAWAMVLNGASLPCLSQYGASRSFSWSHASLTAMPFRSLPDDAAVGDALAIW